MTNRYYKFSKISEAKFRHLLRCYALDLTAMETAVLTGISLRSVTAIYDRLRQKLVQWCEQVSPVSGTVEVDESYFGPRRIPGKRGRGAGGKTIVFGIFQRAGHVYTEIVPDASKRTLQRVIRGHVAVASVIHSDRWRGYDGLVDVGYDKHLRVEHGRNEFATAHSHINGIEAFWSYAKRRLAQFNGIAQHKFLRFLKESEFRFNHRHEDLYKLLLKRLRNDPL
jgi:transposase-like protein